MTIDDIKRYDILDEAPCDITIRERKDGSWVTHDALVQYARSCDAAITALTAELDRLREAVGVRPSVADFARRMEVTLAHHDAKKGGQGNWRKDSARDLIDRIQEELEELRLASDQGRTEDEQAAECVDVANFCLMVVDVLVGLADDPAALNPEAKP